jgi:hypothetical protein
MDEENEQLDYDELDYLETARKKCKELQKAVEIDSLQAVKHSSNERIEDNQKIILTCISTAAIQSQIEVSNLRLFLIRLRYRHVWHSKD